MLRQSFADEDKVKKLNDDIYEKAYIDREHLATFLTCIDTNDAPTIIKEVHLWLENLHNDPKFDKIIFPRGDIDAIIGDLDSYGRVQPESLVSYKQSSNKTIPIS